MWAKRTLWLACLAGLASGCSAAMVPADWGQREPERRPPTARITQSDIAALRETIAALAKSESPARYEAASKKLAELLPRFEAANEAAYVAEAMFWMAYCYECTGRREEAAVFYDQIVRKYAQTSAAEAARNRRSRIETKRPPDAAPAP